MKPAAHLSAKEVSVATSTVVQGKLAVGVHWEPTPHDQKSIFWPKFENILSETPTAPERQIWKTTEEYFSEAKS